MPLDNFPKVTDENELIEYIERSFREAEAWRSTARKLEEAHDYVKKYCSVDGWGRNVWHSILDDAIKMRKNNGTE